MLESDQRHKLTLPEKELQWKSSPFDTDNYSFIKDLITAIEYLSFITYIINGFVTIDETLVLYIKGS